MAPSRTMTRARAAGFAIVAIVGSAQYAEALTLTNRDAASTRITVIRGADRTTHTIAPAATIADLCARGCILKLDDGSEWLLDGSERISIEQALLYYDGPERPAATQPAATSPADTRRPRAPLQR